MSEKLIFVDERDQPIGAGPREEAWEQGYFTRNIRVVLRDENGRFLSQKRSANKSSYPSMWTVAASGHVDDGESWEVAAQRETHEEIGASADMSFVGGFVFKVDEGQKKIRQVIHVYEGTINSSTPLKLQEDEVDELKWYDLDELTLLVKHSPELFTPSFHEIIEKYYSIPSLL
ncbi:MAG: idi [Candidatus Saccharibacteria bacterium]|nr:idi [Candidatus Saccharibacteria bacterium]